MAMAIAREEALERVAKVAQRRERAKEDYRIAAAKIDLKIGEQIKAAFKTGLTASQIARRANLSVPRIYQLRNDWVRHLDAEYAE